MDVYYFGLAGHMTTFLLWSWPLVKDLSICMPSSSTWVSTIGTESESRQYSFWQDSKKIHLLLQIRELRCAVCTLILFRCLPRCPQAIERGCQFVLLGSAPDPKVQAEFDELANELGHGQVRQGLLLWLTLLWAQYHQAQRVTVLCLRTCANVRQNIASARTFLPPGKAANETSPPNDQQLSGTTPCSSPDKSLICICTVLAGCWLCVCV